MPPRGGVHGAAGVGILKVSFHLFFQARAGALGSDRPGAFVYSSPVAVL